MKKHETAIEVIPFLPPYTDEDSIGRIGTNIAHMSENKLPIFQVDVGEDRHLAGTMAVRQIVEAAYNEKVGEIYERSNFLPFRLAFQNMRVPYFLSANHAVDSKRIAPHLDTQQSGPAIHKEYPGLPTAVEGGYQQEGAVLPELDHTKSYEGPGIEGFVDAAYRGIAQLGRLTVFSQGDRAIDMKPTVHYFERAPHQPVGGRFTRFFSLDPSRTDYTKVRSYDEFVDMRKQASMHLDYEQWRLLGYELSQTSGEQYQDLRTMAAEHLADHPGTGYTYWHTVETRGAVTSYGVASPQYPLEEKELFRIHFRN